MKRILTVLVLLLFAGVAWAGTSDAVDTAKTFASTLQPPSTDYSVAYLSQIFGTVGTILQGSSGQMLGQLFAIFNKGVLVVAALYLAMTTVQVCLRAATEGSFMGQNKSVHMIMLRIALGFGLIIPSSSTGYSILQDVFMKIVVAGVGLADQTWSAALNYMEYGGSLFIPPTNISSDQNMVSAGLGSNVSSWPASASSSTPVPSASVVSQVFMSEVCMLMSSNKAFQSGASKGYAQSYQPIFDGHSTIYFPGVGDPYSPQKDSNGVIIGPSGCGQITAYASSSASTWTSQAKDLGKTYSYGATKQLVLNLLPAAKAYVERNLSQSTGEDSGLSPTSLTKAESKQVFSALLDYANLITPYQKLVSQSGEAAGKDILNKAKAQGWIMAGGFYWNVEQANNTSSHSDLSSMYPTVTTLTSSVYNQIAGQPNLLTTLENGVTAITSSGSTINGYWGTYVGAQQNSIQSAGDDGSNSSGGVSGQLTNSVLGTMVSSNFTPDTNGNYNPIVVLMNEGNDLLQIVVTIWITTIALSTVLAIAAGFCNSTSPSGLVFKTAMGWMKSILMIITGALLVPGAILAYYVPMYPFAVFTFAAIGWFGMVLEGMAAAPLVCLGMTHPEGHDFLGKAEQAMMLFLSIFLRPALMVIGMIAFMIVSFVAFQMLISGYGALLAGLQGSAGGNDSFAGSGLLILISKTMVLVIFGMMTMEVIEQCAKLIYQLPNNMSKWIGAPGIGEEYGQMAAAVRGSVSAAAEQGGRGAQLGMETGEAVGRMHGETLQGVEDDWGKKSKESSGSVKPGAKQG